jgi:formylglycine-generating enzyme required for sulfatase activity
MGSPADEKGRNSWETAFDAEAHHGVTLPRPFYLGKYEVTQGQYEAALGKDHNRSSFSPLGKGKDVVKGMATGRFPVEQVSWDDALRFCDVASTRAGRKLTLPTEAEWEYACRAGTETAFHFGSMCDGTQANCKGGLPYGTDRKGPDLQRTCEVGSYPPNAWGLCDMHGNVMEWCRDWYGPYAGLPTTDPEPRDKAASETRAIRGGSWYDAARNCRAAYRGRDIPSGTHDGVGFRVAVLLD